MICANCPVKKKCVEKGYLAQYKQMKNVEIQLFAQQDLFTNPDSEAFYNKIRKEDCDNRICVIDEAEVHKLFNEIIVTKKQLEMHCIMWGNDELGIFAEKLMSIMEEEQGDRHEKIYNVSRTIDELSPDQVSTINDQFTKVKLNIINQTSGEFLHNDQGIYSCLLYTSPSPRD